MLVSKCYLLNCFCILYLMVCKAAADDFMFGVNHVEMNTNLPVSYPCDSDDECKVFLLKTGNSTAKCINGNCACNTSFETSVQSCSLQVQSLLNGSCSNDLNCNVVNSECKNSICICKSGFIGSYNKRKCLTVVHSLNSSCEINAQCTEKFSDSTCFENVCMCKIFYYNYDGQCVKRSGLNKMCYANANCLHINNTVCESNKKCACAKGYVPKKDSKSCLKLAENLSDTCEQNNQCLQMLGPKGVCTSNRTCDCNDLYHLDRDAVKCRKISQFGDICVVHDDCHQLNEPERRLECSPLGRCVCRPSFVQFGWECVPESDLINEASHPTQMVYWLIPIAVAQYIYSS